MNGWKRTALAAAFAFCSLRAWAQITNVSLLPEADAFIRAGAPLENYGRAGSLAVAGASATNGFGAPGGSFDSVLRFSLGDAIASLDAVFGNHDWVVVQAALRLNEVAAPANALFPRGAADAFEVRWLAADAWTEGTGSPSVPTGDGLRYQDLNPLLDPRHDASLGFFTNGGLDHSIVLDLSLARDFDEDLRLGGDVTLHLRPASDTLGFVFNSRNFTTDTARPRLDLTVASGPRPRIVSIERFNATEVLIRFEARSHWTHVVQACGHLASGATTVWTNIFTAPVQPFDRQIEVRDTVTDRHRFYRLSCSYPSFRPDQAQK